MERFNIPALGNPYKDCGLIALEKTSDGLFTAASGGTDGVYSSGDKKVELVVRGGETLALVKSSLGYPAYYPVQPDAAPLPLEAVLMDLDGTTVKSEEFWISIIEMTVKSLLQNPAFTLEEADIPFVSGHSVSEHLDYCIAKYCPDQALPTARNFYYEHTHREMYAILHEGKQGAFTPTAGVKPFLLELKRRGIKLGLVTSGLYEKAYPEILSAFRTLDMGDPAEFYDSIITAGSPLGRGAPGTLGELEAKPHPWLYAESATVGLGIPFEKRGGVIGIEDSGAGVCAVRLAGYHTIGIGGGNILQSGTRAFCNQYCETFDEILQAIEERNRNV